MVVTYQLKSDLARVCLPTPERSAERRLAWVNSLCLFFLLVGLLGDQSRRLVRRNPPPLEQPVPVVIEPLPPAQAAPEAKVEQNDSDKNETPQVVAVTIDAPSINFSVPTIGNLVVPEAVAVAPPAVELKRPVVVEKTPVRINSTGEGGDRPAPPYPEMAQQSGVQGTVVLLLETDEVGSVVSANIKETSGSALLDHAAASFIKRHWIVPPSDGGHLFVVSVRYTLGS